MNVLLAGTCLIALLSAQEELKPRPSGGKGGRTGISTEEKIQVGAVERGYRLVVPESADGGKPAPVLYAFHGLGDSKDLMPRYSKLDDLAKAKGIILVYPNGVNRRWQMVLKGNEDVGFFDALHAEIRGKYDVDLNRVYATGMSNGAYFCHVLAMQRSDVVAAIAPHSGAIGLLEFAGARPKRRFGVFIIHGDADPVVRVSLDHRTRDFYRKAGFPVEYLEIKDLGHRWATAEGINEKIWEFCLKNPMEP